MLKTLIGNTYSHQTLRFQYFLTKNRGLPQNASTHYRAYFMYERPWIPLYISALGSFIKKCNTFLWKNQGKMDDRIFIREKIRHFASELTRQMAEN